MAVTFEQLMSGFGVVTVMDVKLYKLTNGSYLGNDAALIPGDFTLKEITKTVDGSTTKEPYVLDTLKIANFTQEGPTKTITGGQYANPLIKYGKTMTCEMQDALGRAETLVEFFGCDYVQSADGTPGRLSVGDKFPGAFCLEGKTFFIDQQSGEKKYVYILIPQFLPDAILTLTQDAEGDATVFDLNGTVAVTDIADTKEGTARSIFYEIREESWFKKN